MADDPERITDQDQRSRLSQQAYEIISDEPQKPDTEVALLLLINSAYRLTLGSGTMADLVALVADYGE
jgi:hypothetical protein